MWRLWSPLIGIVTGSVTAALFGAYEISSVADAAWVGIPEASGFPGFDLTPGASFWSLLPVFVVATLAGGVKNASGTSVSLIGFTGVAARRIGYVIGGTLLALAFLPKLTAFPLTIPSPVMATYILTAIALICASGVRNVVQDGLDAQKALLVGLAFSLGMGMDI